jgi:hypothetical protein
MYADANKQERIQQEFAALCFKGFLPHVHYSYTYALEQLKLHTLRKRKYHLDALVLSFPFGNFLSSSPCSVYYRYCFIQCLFIKEKLYSVRCASAANVVCREVDVFRTKTALLNHFYCGTLLLLKY